MDEKGFKKLLIDLEWSREDLGQAAGISGWAVTLYFRGNLQAETTRVRIKQVLRDRARRMGVTLPRFWEDAAA